MKAQQTDKHARADMKTWTTPRGMTVFVLMMLILQGGIAQNVQVAAGTVIRITGGTSVRLNTLEIQNTGTGILETGSTVTVFSALSNDGTLTCEDGSTTAFWGGTQIVSGPTVFANLTKTGGGTLFLNDSITVNGTLLVDSGTITIGSFDLTIGPAGSIGGATPFNYVVTSDTGALRQTVGSSSVLFPVGPTTASYNPAMISNAGVPDVFSARVQSIFENPVPNPDGLVDRQWTVHEHVPGGSNAALTLQWNIADEGSAFMRENPLSIGRYDGGQWIPTTAVFADAGGESFTATASGFDDFTAFLVGNNVALAVANDGQGIPAIFSLDQNYPNPFNPTTSIEFTLPRDGMVILKVYDITGREVATLVDEELESGVYHHAIFNASGFASGIYIARIEMGGEILARRMVLVK
jgi:hypothetical protein